MDIPGPERIRRELARITGQEFIDGMDYAAPVILAEVQFLLPDQSDLWPKAAHVCFRRLVSQQLKWRVRRMPERYIRLLCRAELAPLSKRARQLGWNALMSSTGWRPGMSKATVTLTPSGMSALKVLSRIAASDGQAVSTSQLIEFGIKKALSAIRERSGQRLQEVVDKLSQTMVTGAQAGPRRQ